MKTTLLASLLAASPAFAFSSGPVAAVGVVLTPEISRDTPISTGSGSSTANLQLGALQGPNIQVGYELGNRFNNQFTLVFTSASGPINGSGAFALKGSAQIQIYGAAYQFAFEPLGKEGWRGFSPYLGVGMVAGVFSLSEPLQASGGGTTVTSTGTASGQPYLEFHATAGARYTFSNGFGLR